VSLRKRILPVFDRLRALAGPARFDLRPSRVAVVTRTWTGGRREADPPPGSPVYIDAVLELAPIYKVRQLATREIAGSGARYEVGDVAVGPITPAFTKRDGTRGGYSEADLAPSSPRAGVEIFYRVLGAHEGEYERVELRSFRPFAFELVLRRRETTP
jgi:hypothetical protein